MKKVSIIIPCYNVSAYIDYCLQSLLQQTIGREALEIILIDDASTDCTRDILMRYEQQYPETIMLICNDVNAKQGACRNLGLQYSTGEYISFVDGDDWVDLRMYEILVNVIEQSEDADLVQFLHRNEEKEQAFCTEQMGKFTYYRYDTFKARRNMLLSSDILNESCTAKFYRRSLLFDKEGNLRSFYAEGTFYEEPLFTYPLKFYVRASYKLDMPLYVYRHNLQGTVNQAMKDMNRMYDHLAVQKAVLNVMRRTEFYDVYKTEIDFYFLHTFCVEPFFFLSYRKEEVPMEMLQIIIDTTKEIYGCIPDNPYFDHASLQGEKKIMELLQRFSSSV